MCTDWCCEIRHTEVPWNADSLLMYGTFYLQVDRSVSYDLTTTSRSGQCEGLRLITGCQQCGHEGMYVIVTTDYIQS